MNAKFKRVFYDLVINMYLVLPWKKYYQWYTAKDNISVLISNQFLFILRNRVSFWCGSVAWHFTMTAVLHLVLHCGPSNVGSGNLINNTLFFFFKYTFTYFIHFIYCIYLVISKINNSFSSKIIVFYFIPRPPCT